MQMAYDSWNGKDKPQYTMQVEGDMKKKTIESLDKLLVLGFILFT